VDKTVISKNNLHIARLINVVKSNTKSHNKSLLVKSRHSDAFVYILSGSCTYDFDDGYEFTVNSGDILYLAHKSCYTMHIHTEDYHFIFCDFEFAGADMKKSEVFSPKSPSYAENLFYKLLKCYKSPDKSSFAESMSVLYKIYGAVIMSANEAYLSTMSRNRVEQAKEYIDLNFKDTALSICMLAEKAAVSEVYFRKLFKSRYGISPSQYIITLRLKNAKLLMQYPFLSIKECALQSGFSSMQYFCRAFKKAMGTTPAKYRNNR